MKSLLITGGAGFIGSHMIAYLLEKYDDYHIINLDVLTYAGDLENLKGCDSNERYTFVEGNIVDVELVEKVFEEHDIRGVIHLAAESHVDNSISEPGVFVDTNIKGAYVLIEAARKHWMEAPGIYKKGYEDCRFHQVSTDEVYGSLGKVGCFSEASSYAPSSPYSASKAAADMILNSFHITYGLNTVISNCSNNYGPHQHSEKLIPTIIQKALDHEAIPIYGDGENVRDWLHVLDHCRALDCIYHQGTAGDTYMVGGANELDNLTIARQVCSLLDELYPSETLDSYQALITLVDDRAGHDRRYAVDFSKLENELMWKPEMDFIVGLRRTIQWYLARFLN